MIRAKNKNSEERQSAKRKFIFYAVVLAVASLGCIAIGIDIAATGHFQGWVQAFGSLWLNHRRDRGDLAGCFVLAGIFCGAGAISLFDKAMYYAWKK